VLEWLGLLQLASAGYFCKGEAILSGAGCVHGKHRVVPEAHELQRARVGAKHVFVEVLSAESVSTCAASPCRLQKGPLGEIMNSLEKHTWNMV